MMVGVPPGVVEAPVEGELLHEYCLCLPYRRPFRRFRHEIAKKDCRATPVLQIILSRSKELIFSTAGHSRARRAMAVPL